MKIQVLLSTYNGETYLAQQLDSVFSQEGHAEISMLIRDDGSADRTRSILEQYRKKYSCQVVCGENIGIERSYLWLLENRDKGCDLFAFCDQDDVWYPNKLENTIDSLKCVKRDEPILFAAQSDIVKSDMTHIRFSDYPSQGVSFYHAMVQNCCPGHTFAFNNCMADLILHTKKSDCILVMDWWIYLIASGLGTVCFLPKPLVYHRQHGTNAVGYDDSRWKHWKQKISRFSAKHSAEVGKQMESFREQFGDCLPVNYRTELDAFLDSRRDIFKRLSYLHDCHIYRNNSEETRSLKLLYAVGEFND